MARSRRGPLIPPDRLRPPNVDWSDRLRRQEQDQEPDPDLPVDPVAAPGDTTPPWADGSDAVEPTSPVVADTWEADATEPVEPRREDAPAPPPEEQVAAETEGAGPVDGDAAPTPADSDAERPPTDAGPLSGSEPELSPFADASSASSRDHDGTPAGDGSTQRSEGADDEVQAAPPHEPEQPEAEHTTAEYQQEFDALVAPERFRLDEPAPPTRAVRDDPAPPRAGPSDAWPPRRRRLELDGRVVGGVVIAALTAACVALLLLNIQRINDSQLEAARQAASYSPPVLASGSPPGARLVTVLGGDADRSGADAVPGTTLLARGLDGADVQVHTAPGIRYVSTRSGDPDTFARLVASVDPASTVVVLLGGGGDRGDSTLSLESAAPAAVQAVQRAAPNARVVIVGPVWASSKAAPQELLRVRSTLKAAARSTSASFVDPIAGKWLQERSGLVTASGRLTDAGRQELAKRLTRSIAAYLK